MKTRSSLSAIAPRRTAVGWTFVVFSLLTAALWLASGWWPRPHENFPTPGVCVARGCVYVWIPLSADEAEDTHLEALDAAGFPRIGDNWGGPRWRMWEWRHPSGWAGKGPFMFAVPIWLFVALLSTPAAILLLSAIRARHRAKADACHTCGYSLTGLGDGATCPECGEAAAASMP